MRSKPKTQNCCNIQVRANETMRNCTQNSSTAYRRKWQEWDIFKLPGGVTGFMIIHLFLIFFVLYGLIMVFRQSFTGLIFSLLLSLSGIFAFTIHADFYMTGQWVTPGGESYQAYTLVGMWYRYSATGKQYSVVLPDSDKWGEYCL